MKYCGCLIIYSAYALFALTFLMAINFYTPIVIVFLLLTAALATWGIQTLEKEEVKTITQNSKYEGIATKKAVITEKDCRIFCRCWSLTNFLEQYGNIVEIKDFVNSTTGKPFKSCIINNKGKNKLYLSFSSSLGELTLSEITKRKEELKVGLTSKGYYKLYDDNIQEWETIDFNELTEERIIKENNLEDKENRENLNTINKVKEKNIDDLFRGINPNEEETMNKYKELCQTVYDGSEDYEVNLLTWVQKLSLFGLITLIGSHDVLSNKREQVGEIIKDFADTIELSKKDYDEVTSNALKSERTYIHIIKDIHLDYPINMMFESWRELAHIDESTDKVILSKLITTAKELGFTDEECQDLTGNRYIHKYS